MFFNSMEFAIFLPIVFVLYWSLPHKYRWCCLLGASYYFYMSWNAKYIVLIVLSTVVCYVAGILIEKEKQKKRQRIILVVALVICFGILFFFKYFNFVSESITAILNQLAVDMNPITLDLLLPVGISFYTFQTLSYVVDVYRGQVKAEHHFGFFATFISFFPQLVAGPIERTQNLLPQFKEEKKFDYDQAVYGLRLMLWGFFKKLAIADVLSVYVDRAYNSLDNCSGLDLLIVIFFFTIQIYCDFSGYSDIAIGTAKLMGIQLMTNFKSPYFSKSVKEFWQRWHISLSSWFRDYVYIPLGGNRCSKFRNAGNVCITFLLSGLWHGANWTFVLWGGIHGIAQILEKNLFRFKIKKGKLYNFISVIIVFSFCNLAWVFFRAATVQDALFVISKLFLSLRNPSGFFHITIGISKLGLIARLLPVGLLAIYDYASLKMDVIDWIGSRKAIIRWGIYFLMVFFIIYRMPLETSSFIYFQF